MKMIRKTVLLAPFAAAALLLAGCGMGEPDTTVRQAAPTPSQSQEAAAQEEQAEPISQQEGEGDTESAPTNAAAEAQGDTQTQAPTVNPIQAANTALASHEGSQVIGISLDRTHGVTVWEVEVTSQEGEWEVSVDAVTGDIILDEVDGSEDHAEHLQLLADSALDYEMAVAAMLAAVPKGSLIEVELDDEHGLPVWEGEVLSSEHQKYHVSIDATTGEVLENKIDD